jgi:hypothetical protein
MDYKVIEEDAARRQGHSCEACGQFVKLYRRKLSSQMALWLVKLVRLSQARPLGAWIEVAKDCPTHGGDYAKLAAWGLVEQKQEQGDGSTRTSGRWRPTRAGRDFAENRLRVPSHAYFYNRRCEGFTRETVNCKEALGARFNYAELMGHAQSNGNGAHP